MQARRQKPDAASGGGDPGHEAVSSSVGSRAREAFYALKRVMMLYRQLAFRAFSDHGVHPGQAACLFALSESDGISQRELASKLLVSAPTVTGMLQKMERAGLVERWPDQTDQRLMRIRLTERGAQVAARLAETVRQQAGTIFDGFSETDLDSLRKMLESAGDNIARAISGCESDELSPAKHEE